MILSTKKKILVSYLFISILLILTWAFFNYYTYRHRNLLNITQQNIPPKWYEYITDYLTLLLLPAIYGLFAYVPFKRLGRGNNSGRGFFIGALVIGVTVSFLSWGLSGLGRIDCGNNCAAYVPSYNAEHIIALSVIPMLIIVPGIIVVYYVKTDKQ